MSDVNRVIIERIVRKTLNDIKEAPERSARNLLDLALNFSNGRFSHRFLSAIRNLLENEHSAYYRLISDTVSNVNNEALIQFSMNTGYNSCTLGAKTIRRIENEQHFDIPWCLALELDKNKLKYDFNTYNSIIEQGKKLGIYTWVLSSDSDLIDVLPLISQNKDCAFVLLCSPDDITRNLVSEAVEIDNLMFSVQYKGDVIKACELMRYEKLLYSVYIMYDEEDEQNIKSGKLFDSAEEAHPVLTMLIPKPGMPKEFCTRMYSYVVDARESQQYMTIPMDLTGDVCYIDSVISDSYCAASFDKNGNFFTMCEKVPKEKYNIFNNKLEDILKKAFSHPQICY